jgi:hypothetical protein
VAREGAWAPELTVVLQRNELPGDDHSAAHGQRVPEHGLGRWDQKAAMSRCFSSGQAIGGALSRPIALSFEATSSAGFRCRLIAAWLSLPVRRID